MKREAHREKMENTEKKIQEMWDSVKRKYAHKWIPRMWVEIEWVKKNPRDNCWEVLKMDEIYQTTELGSITNAE